MATNTKQIGRNEKNMGSHNEGKFERAHATKAKIHSNIQKAVGIQREGGFIEKYSSQCGWRSRY